MKDSEILEQRLENQHLATPDFKQPSDVVSWLGAVQAQDFAGAKWALGLRMQDAVEAGIERAFNEGAILRTHALRPTWHFLTPRDIRWVLMLTAPRVHAVNAFMYRRLGLDGAILYRANDIIAKALQGGKQLTRDELRLALEQEKIHVGEGLRLAYFMMHAELDGVICSGARRGKQFTYALLSERAPQAQILDRDESIIEFARRFFTSRGPAAVQDFAKWSGLSVADANHGLDSVKSRLLPQEVDGRTLWGPPPVAAALPASPTAYLLSVYDEYFSGYKNRIAISDEDTNARLTALGSALGYIIVINGRIRGTWKRVIGRQQVVIQANPFSQLTQAETQAVALAAERYGKFLQRPVLLE